MPPDSDDEGSVGERATLATGASAAPARAGYPAGGAAPLAPAATQLPAAGGAQAQARQAGAGTAALLPGETPAEYVERMKRDLSGATTGASGQSGSPEAPAAARAPAAPVQAAATRGANGQRATAAPASEGDGSEEESEDDGAACAGRGGVPWKANAAAAGGGVRQMVQEFAREERARESRGPPRQQQGGVASRTRPPKAPPAAAATPPAEAKAQASPTSAVRPGEELQFSRKPRPVDFAPATLDEYKNKYGEKGAKQELGKLGADLDDEELQLKKAVQMRTKQYCAAVHAVNRERSLSSGPPRKAEPKPEPKSNARAKAAEFAKNIPKPAPKPKAEPSPSETRKPEVRGPSPEDLARADLEEIAQREQQHFADLARVRQIKEFLHAVEVG